MYKKVLVIILLLMSFTSIGWTSFEELYFQKIRNKEIIFENTSKYTYIKTENINDRIYINNVIVIRKESGDAMLGSLFRDSYITIMKDNKFYKMKTTNLILDSLLIGDKINIGFSVNQNKLVEICKYK